MTNMTSTDEKIKDLLTKTTQATKADVQDDTSFAGRLWAPVFVHIFTALGVVAALLATLSVINGFWELAFAWLGVALVIDGVDGPLARWAQVTTALPRFSGERLDLVIDYLTYVFIPCLMLLQAGFLNGPMGIVFAALILLSSLFHFSDQQSKSVENYFIGFPAAWNVIVFYIFAFALSEFWTAVVVLFFSLLTFVPFKWVHPVRVRQLRWVTLALAVVWLCAAGWVLVHGLPAALWPGLVLLATAAYAGALSLSKSLRVSSVGAD